MPKLILVRHGKSAYNLQDRFAGWVDTPLEAPGYEDARGAARMLMKRGLRPDYVFVSPLARAAATWEEMNKTLRSSAPVAVDWRLMERHYGALSGQSREQIKEKLGEDAYMGIRRGYAESPDEIAPAHAEYDAIGKTALRCGVPENCVPLRENLEVLAKGRVKEAYEAEILPKLKAGKDVLVVSHGNTMRALTFIIQNLTPEEIRKVEYKQGEPVVFEFTPEMKLQSVKNLAMECQSR